MAIEAGAAMSGMLTEWYRNRWAIVLSGHDYIVITGGRAGDDVF